MRKVLLATTALVAMSVTAAQADITISGAASFEVLDDGSGNVFTSDGDINIKATSVTDSGLTLTAYQDSQIEDNTVADSYINIAGDFGNLRMGNTDDALDLNDGVLGSTMDIDGSAIDTISTEIGGNSVNISYTAPSVGGFKPYLAVQADGAYTGVGFNYGAGPVTVMFQSVNKTASDDTVIGASFTAGAITVGAGAKESNANGTKTKTNDIGVKYVAGDVTLIGTHRKSGNTKYNSLGAKYTVAPGLTAAIESGEQGTANATYAALTVAF